MLQDLLAVFPLAALVLIATILSEWAVKREWLPNWLSRKLLQTIAVGVCAVAPLLVQDLLHLFYLVLPIWLVLIVLVARGIMMQDEQGRPAWGIVWFPLAYLILLFFAGDQVGLVVFPMAVLAVCDPMATICGTLFARAYYQLTGEEKSQTGNAAFFLSFLFLAAWLVPILGLDYGRPYIKIYLIIFGLIVTASEALGSFGRDNLYVPLVTAMLLQRLASPIVEIWPLVITTVATIPFMWWTVRRNSLSLGGALSASVLAIMLVLFSQWLLLIPLLLFFASSVLIGRLFPTQVQSDIKAGKARDTWQVICNGGIYVLLLFLLFPGAPDTWLSIGSWGGQITNWWVTIDVLQLAYIQEWYINFCTSAGGGIAAETLVLVRGLNLPPPPYNLEQMELYYALTEAKSQYAPFAAPLLLIPLASVAIATADTWSSEIGQHFQQRTYDLWRFRRVQAGLSGGVSFPGNLAGFLGAAFIGTLCFTIFNVPLSWVFFLAIAFTGFFGMLMDSLLGAAFQAKYVINSEEDSQDEASGDSASELSHRRPTRPTQEMGRPALTQDKSEKELGSPKLTQSKKTRRPLKKFSEPRLMWSDQPNFQGQKPIRGFSWMSNDWVNLLSQIIVIGILLWFI